MRLVFASDSATALPYLSHSRRFAATMRARFYRDGRRKSLAAHGDKESAAPPPDDYCATWPEPSTAGVSRQLLAASPA